MKKIIRTICLFSNEITTKALKKLEEISSLLKKNDFSIQTKRFCLSSYQSNVDEKIIKNNNLFVSMGSLSFNELQKNLQNFLSSTNKYINLDLTNNDLTKDHIEILFKIIEEQPSNTFKFTYSFNLPFSSPFFPSAKFQQEGFGIGLQSCDLSENCKTLDEWLNNMKKVWDELNELLNPIPDYLGIDSSIAPLYEGHSSLINFIKRLGTDFTNSTITNIYTTISNFIKKNNPKPIGSCGIMFPCLEDYELAEEYNKGNFNIERNIFLSLHSGVGIDTYPIGINQNKRRLLEILKLIQALSNKYQKPLTVRFVSDGKTKIKEKSDFKNSYLKDVIIKEI